MKECVNPTWYEFSFAFGGGQVDSRAHWLSAMARNAQAKERGVRYRVLCNGPVDVFHPSPSYDLERRKLWTLIQETPQLDWLLPTMHPENVMSQVPCMGYWRNRWHQLPPNVWVGAVIDGPGTRNRLTSLLQVPAQVRFVAYLPLRGPVPYPISDTSRTKPGAPPEEAEDMLQCKRCEAGVWESVRHCPNCYSDGRLEWNPESMIQWVVVGGDSEGLTPCRLEEVWLRDLLADWRTYQVPIYLTQAGSYLARQWGCLDATGATLEELPVDFRVRELPEHWHQQAAC